jgi:hypothetical protein
MVKKTIKSTVNRVKNGLASMILWKMVDWLKKKGVLYAKDIPIIKRKAECPGFCPHKNKKDCPKKCSKIKVLYLSALTVLKNLFTNPSKGSCFVKKIQRTVQSYTEAVCESVWGTFLGANIQYHVEDIGFTTKSNTCFTTDTSFKLDLAPYSPADCKPVSKGGKYTGKLNEIVCHGDKLIDNMLTAGWTEHPLAGFFTTFGVREDYATSLRLANPKNPDKPYRIDIPRTSETSDATLVYVTCAMKGRKKHQDCALGHTKQGQVGYARKGDVLCVMKLELEFGLCSTCCCKGGMIRFKKSMQILHKVQGYNCAKHHMLTDAMMSAGINGYRLMKTVVRLGLNREKHYGNGCLD